MFIFYTEAKLENKCLEWIFCPVQMANELWRRTKQQLIYIEMHKRKWGLFVGYLRPPSNEVARMAYVWNPRGNVQIYNEI